MPILLFTEHNTASNNLAHAFIERGYEKINEAVWKKGTIEIINTHADSVISVPTHFKTDYLIVLSSHKSKQDQHALTVHYPGNWDTADMGGAPRTLNIAYASKVKQIMQEMQKLNSDNEWEITLEADHHGPTCDTPIMFVEMGSTQREWNDKKGAALVAQAVERAIQTNCHYKTIFAIGEGHYPRFFNKIALEDPNIAVGHILPKYHLKTLTEDTFKQAIEKNVEEVTEVWAVKEYLNVKQRELVQSFCDQFKVNCVLV